MKREPLIEVHGVAAPLLRDDVDTDQIIPSAYLKDMNADMAQGLLAYMRRTPDGQVNHDFVLERPAFKAAPILIVGNNFGCGSSREHAPWALEDFGFRAIIAPSYADIFFNNCYKNGLLPICLQPSEVDRLFHDAAAIPGFQLVIDLGEQVVATTDGSQRYRFDVDEFRKYCLINGLDDIGLTLRHADKIKAYEDRRRHDQPWLF